MNKSFTLATVSTIAVVAALALVAVTLLGENSAPQLFLEDFEGNENEGLGEWSTDADVPPDPNNPGNPVQWNITRSATVYNSPAHSAEVFIDGRQDDGTIWLERRVSVEKTGNAWLNVSFWLFSE